MSRLWRIAALLTAGCSSPPVLEEPSVQLTPPALIAKSGASLYVLEGPEGWCEVAAPGASEVVAERDLRTLLRHGLSRQGVFLVGHADFQPWQGLPAEAALFNPDSEGHRSEKVGFRVRITAKPQVEGGCSVEWSAEQLTDRVGRNREIEKIDDGSRVIPFGSSILVRHPAPEGREYVLLLRVVSLRKP